MTQRSGTALPLLRAEAQAIIDRIESWDADEADMPVEMRLTYVVGAKRVEPILRWFLRETADA